MGRGLPCCGSRECVCDGQGRSPDHPLYEKSTDEEIRPRLDSPEYNLDHLSIENEGPEELSLKRSKNG